MHLVKHGIIFIIIIIKTAYHFKHSSGTFGLASECYVTESGRGQKMTYYPLLLIVPPSLPPSLLPLPHPCWKVIVPLLAPGRWWIILSTKINKWVKRRPLLYDSISPTHAPEDSILTRCSFSAWRANLIVSSIALSVSMIKSPWAWRCNINTHLRFWHCISVALIFSHLRQTYST